jgi:hypothetical protein
MTRTALGVSLAILSVLLLAQGPGRCADGPKKGVGEKPLALHPDNPHYFLFRGKPAVLITSGEHYGAVLNRDFNITKYLDELKAHGLNLTRTFTGVYCEDNKSFGITRNTLAPAAGKLICPWARSATPGYAGGGNKFDLSKWDRDYFVRLKGFLERASKRGIVVELALFCPFYDDSMWKLSPMNAANNVNRVGKLARTAVYDRKKNGPLQAVQEALVKKIVAELNGFDNLYYEVCNEPYFGGVTDDWQRRIVDVLAAAEKPLANKHLISQNVANGAKKVERPHPAVSIFNFHYASPPDAVAQNFRLNKVIGENETGFKGTADTHYRMEGWEFVLAGGGLFNNLDYSFAVGPRGRHVQVPREVPGRGQPRLPQADEGAQGLHPRLRFRAHEAGRRRGERWLAAEGPGARARRAGQAVRALPVRRAVRPAGTGLAEGQLQGGVGRYPVRQGGEDNGGGRGGAGERAGVAEVQNRHRPAGAADAVTG